MPLLWLSLAFLIGIGFSSLAVNSIEEWAFFSILLLGISLIPTFLKKIEKRLPSLLNKLARWKNVPRINNIYLRSEKTGLALSHFFPMVAIAIILGAARYQAALPEINDAHIANYNDTEKWVEIVGVVDQPLERRDYYSNLWVDVQNIKLNDLEKPLPVEGGILARISSDLNFNYGDRVILFGELEEPAESEQFSYKGYLFRKGIYSTLSYPDVLMLESGQGDSFRSAIYAFKEKALGLIYQFFPDPEASLMAGILLGVETGIPKDVKDAFQDTGTSHIIAISGFNITILAALFSTSFGKFLGRRRGAIVAVLGISIYTILVGADAAVVRAAIMGGLSLFARQVGRRQDGLNSLAISAAAMNLFNPMLLWDVGFQLSFMATLGLVLYADVFKQKFESWVERWVGAETAKRLSGPVGEYFLFTVAAQITILPILVYHFQKLSLTSIPANILILPAQPFVMILGGIAVLVGLAFFPLGQLLSYLAWPFIAYTIRVVEWFAQFRGGVVAFGQVTLLFVIVYYLVLFSTTKWGTQIKGRISDIKPILIVAILAFLTMVTWQGVLNAPNGKLQVTMLDVGTGDAILITSPEGRNVLINGGPSASQLSDQLGRWLPLFHREIDFLVIASTQENQVQALPNSIERFSPTEVLWAGVNTASRSARYLRQTLTDMEIPVVRMEQGQELCLGEDAVLKVVSVGSRGASLLLVWDDFRMLLPIGLSFDEMEDLAMGKQLGPITALTMADNGYGPINPPEWINNLHPELILLSVEAGDYAGLPYKETLEAVEGYALLRTDQNGWIHIESNGKEMWLEVEQDWEN